MPLEQPTVVTRVQTEADEPEIEHETQEIEHEEIETQDTKPGHIEEPEHEGFAPATFERVEYDEEKEETLELDFNDSAFARQEMEVSVFD